MAEQQQSGISWQTTATGTQNAIDKETGVWLIGEVNKQREAQGLEPLPDKPAGAATASLEQIMSERSDATWASYRDQYQAQSVSEEDGRRHKEAYLAATPEAQAQSTAILEANPRE